MKEAKNSFGKPYPCQMAWPNDCYVQCGDSGLVLGEDPYETAFFEAFPKNPSTFIRGEGSTIAEAELSAWQQYQGYLNCSEHSFKRYRSEDSTHGICTHCKLFLSNIFEPLTSCKCCGKQGVKFSLYTDEQSVYCLTHYLEKALPLVEAQYRIEDINSFMHKRIQDADIKEQYDIKDAFFSHYVQKYDVWESKDLSDFDKYLYLDKKEHEFNLFLVNQFRLRAFYRQENEVGFKELTKLPAIHSNRIPSYIFLDRDLYLQMFKAFFAIDNYREDQLDTFTNKAFELVINDYQKRKEEHK